jgi:hypothetical protein
MPAPWHPVVSDAASYLKPLRHSFFQTEEGKTSFMTKLAAAVAILAVGLTLAGCGGGSNNNSGNVNGNWTASLTDTGGSQIFAFTTTITQSGNGMLTINNFHFTSNSPCFVSGETESGTFTLSGDFNGNVTGAFGFSIQSGSPSGNTLTLTGSANGGTISGSWALTGSIGCTGAGSFTMTRS